MAIAPPDNGTPPDPAHPRNAVDAGVISYVVIKLAKGKAREIHPLLYGVAALFVLYFLRGPIESAVL